jgi:hypothetical protein
LAKESTAMPTKNIYGKTWYPRSSAYPDVNVVFQQDLAVALAASTTLDCMFLVDAYRLDAVFPGFALGGLLHLARFARERQDDFNPAALSAFNTK